MTLRSVVLAILSLLALIFLILNWQGITASVPVNLIVEEIQAPLGLILLVILGGLWLFGIAWALMQQASTLVEIRKAYKEANANKSLADHAEQSRLEQTKESLRQEMVKNREELLAGIKAAVEVPTTSAVNAQKRLEAVEKALEKLSLQIEQIADKAQIGPAPELPAPEPKKSGFFGFLGGSKPNKEEKSPHRRLYPHLPQPTISRRRLLSRLCRQLNPKTGFSKKCSIRKARFLCPVMFTATWIR